MITQAQKGEQFRDLHLASATEGAFILPNPWDVGSAKVLAGLGAAALATTSAGHAFTLGKADMGHVSRDEALAHAAMIADATPLPVSGDLENGYGDAPQTVAKTVQLAAEAGLVGCSIEDTDMRGAYPALGFDLAVSRIEAAVAAARALPFPFTLTARADGIMNGVYNTDEAIRRLIAFEAAGADVLYAPLPPDMAALKRICQAVDKPVNALCAGPFTRYTQADFTAAGVRRISIGSALARVTHRLLVDAGQAMLADGDFSALANGIAGGTVDALLQNGTSIDHTGVS